VPRRDDTPQFAQQPPSLSATSAAAMASPPYVPKYESPKAAAERRARLRTTLYWTAVAIPVAAAVLLFGYSDQAPAFLRDTVVALDGMFGHPILALLTALASR
jgi:hypothetical protein